MTHPLHKAQNLMTPPFLLRPTPRYTFWPVPKSGIPTFLCSLTQNMFREWYTLLRLTSNQQAKKQRKSILVYNKTIIPLVSRNQKNYPILYNHFVIKF